MAVDSRECVATFDHLSRLQVEGGEDICGYPEDHIVHEHDLFIHQHALGPSVGCHDYQPPEDNDANV